MVRKGVGLDKAIAGRIQDLVDTLSQSSELVDTLFSDRFANAKVGLELPLRAHF